MLVGDPLQLMPTLSYVFDPTSDESENGMELTLFERLAQDGWLKPTLLRTQYRCHPDIAQISNKLFYDGILLHGDNTNRPNLVPGFNPLSIVKVDGHENSVGSSYKNVIEGNVVTRCVTQILAHGVESQDVGVICLCTYFLILDKAQVSQIQNQMASKGIPKSVLVSTVDAFQGAEKDVIILSLVRTKLTSFLQDKQRINVALTRAKRYCSFDFSHLIVIGNSSIFEGQGVWKQVARLGRPIQLDQLYERIESNPSVVVVSH